MTILLLEAQVGRPRFGSLSCPNDNDQASIDTLCACARSAWEWACSDSNRESKDYESSALTIKLQARRSSPRLARAGRRLNFKSGDGRAAFATKGSESTRIGLMPTTADQRTRMESSETSANSCESRIVRTTEWKSTRTTAPGGPVGRSVHSARVLLRRKPDTGMVTTDGHGSTRIAPGGRARREVRASAR